MSTLYYESSLTHHGVKGQKWGIRRFQNFDGTLIKDGKTRLATYKSYEKERLESKYSKKTSIYNSRVETRKAELDKAKLSGDDKKIRKADDALTKAETKKFLNDGRKAMEASKIKNMTLGKMQEEKMALYREYGWMALMSIATSGAALVPMAFAITSVSPDNVKTNHRISREENKQLKEIAADKADKNRKKR